MVLDSMVPRTEQQKIREPNTDLVKYIQFGSEPLPKGRIAISVPNKNRSVISLVFNFLSHLDFRSKC
ncbi:hypothetical protein L2E82_41428 [Cichorium intybus]|uniref:Uncharacterized protein n=1 Tax=Cichorium intybus TaxID=13427 RepID=A0ACB9ASG8_CICIN|nr:hypothetical protein L2E82_41428 [Cichorium intybus]